MSYPEYIKDLYEIYKSEVTGEAMFNTLAALSWSAPRREKWRVLAALETQTKLRYLEHLESVGQSLSYPSSASIGGRFFGMIFLLLPWSVAMKGLLSGTPPLIEVFQRLVDHAAEDEREFFEYVLAHERAIAEFAAPELAGQSDEALQPVQALLD